MTTSTWLWILAGLVVLGMGTWMVASGNKTAEAPTATSTIATTSAAGLIDTEEPDWTDTLDKGSKE